MHTIDRNIKRVIKFASCTYFNSPTDYLLAFFQEKRKEGTFLIARDKMNPKTIKRQFLSSFAQNIKFLSGQLTPISSNQNTIYR